MRVCGAGAEWIAENGSGVLRFYGSLKTSQTCDDFNKILLQTMAIHAHATGLTEDNRHTHKRQKIIKEKRTSSDRVGCIAQKGRVRACV
jgi:hypothetical protein